MPHAMTCISITHMRLRQLARQSGEVRVRHFSHKYNGVRGRSQQHTVRVEKEVIAHTSFHSGRRGTVEEPGEGGRTARREGRQLF